MTDEQIVKARHPDADVFFGDLTQLFWIQDGRGFPLGGDSGSSSEAEAWADAASRLPKEQAAADDNVKRWIESIVQDVAELPNRTSPDENPEHMTVTAKELYAIIEDRCHEIAMHID
jgi:hypothetical protein